ncbi:hypothetical protein GGR92_003654 [Spirosoma lacussanchae]|uniref:hypothetical protein n=1 Tax=Spirosoma lacussanchae TaxID=1884249 RepID=UPI00110937B9
MQIFKIVRFWLVWILAAPLVFLFLVGAAVVSGQWRLIGVKFQLIQMSLNQRFVGKAAKFPNVSK